MWLHLYETGIWLLVGVLLIPIGVFVLECLLAIWPRWNSRSLPAGPRPRTVVLIPAHNEELVIGNTLATLLPTLGVDDSVLVIADNCTDQTAEVARACGAVVLERHDASRRGKSYALNFGVRHLESQPPAAVVVLDADCRVDPLTVELLARVVAHTQRPAQCLNLCESDPEAVGIHAVSGLGFRFKNLVRPLGLMRAGLPCLLMGTGMAFPWNVLQAARLDSGELAEDMRLGVELAIRGQAPVFCPEVRVVSALPRQAAAFLSQRTRWEHGHLATSLAWGPQLFLAGWRARRWELWALALDLTVPPVSLLIVSWGVAAFLAGMGWWLGASSLPMQVLLTAGALTGVVILGGWARYCREAVPWTALLSIPWYVLRKLPIYAKFLVRRRQQEWVRTAREPSVKQPQGR